MITILINSMKRFCESGGNELGTKSSSYSTICGWLSPKRSKCEFMGLEELPRDWVRSYNVL